MDTIYGLATVAGKSGVAVIRISGNYSLNVLQCLGVVKNPKPRFAQLATLYEPNTQEPLDQALVIYFQAPHSFTGEDVVELHIHGGLSVIKDVVASLQKLPFLRLAEPGEFSKRAFKAGKLDLTAAEGLAALINSETTMQRKLALRQYGGELANLYESWRNKLVNCLAHLEALIDFPEDDIPQTLLTQIKKTIAILENDIHTHLQNSKQAEVLWSGINVAIIGRPNVGKSSLINWLSNKEAAIVSEIAGTTRDVLEIKVDIDGFPITIKDTAGMRVTEDLIEAEGIKRARAAMQDANIIIMMMSADKKDHSLDKALFNEALACEAQVMLVINKIDLAEDTDLLAQFSHELIPISLAKKLGLDAFKEKLITLLKAIYTPSNDPVLTTARYRQQLNQCIEALHRYHSAPTIELASEEVRLASSSLGAITGQVEVEEVLDIIFSSFCIGK
jgi:tRNA modification GTPase